MRIIIEKVKIIDPNSSLNTRIVDVLIDKGRLSIIDSAKAVKADLHINQPGLMLSPSWVDLRVFSGEPGEEYREDYVSLSQVLLNGGFGHALLMPNTNPVVQNKSAVQLILSLNTGQFPLQIHPSAAISKDAVGEEMNEMLDLYTAGARAFTDGAQPMWNSDLLVKTLLYLQKFDGLLINFPQDHKLAMFGQMNEGVVSTGLGMKGIPNVAEEIMIQRDLELLRYAGGKIHFSCISTTKSVALIKAAKKEGLSVSCDVNIHHLILDDSYLESFDANYKVLPPLRSKQDVKALIKGVNEGVIDCIVSAHQPYDEDHKKMEFDLADFGIMGAQLVFPIYQKYLLDKISLATFVQCVSINPRVHLGLSPIVVEDGVKADFTLYTDELTWTFDDKNNHSKSNNSPFFRQEFAAAAVAVFQGEKHFISPIIN